MAKLYVCNSRLYCGFECPCAKPHKLTEHCGVGLCLEYQKATCIPVPTKKKAKRDCSLAILALENVINFAAIEPKDIRQLKSAIKLLRRANEKKNRG